MSTQAPYKTAFDGIDIPLHQEKLFTRSERRGECLLWTGATSNQGYGVVGISRTRKLCTVHRLAWILAYGEIPGNLLVRHKCGHKTCIELSHLELGTHGDNLRDAWTRKERVYGESYFQTKVQALVTKLGGLSWKLAGVSRRGFPDLLIAGPNGRILLVELKIPGGKLSPQQLLAHKLFADMHHPPVVIYTYEQAVEVLSDFFGERI